MLSVDTYSPTAEDLHALLADHVGHGPHELALRLISLTPTPHRATLSTGARVYTWCVLDAFILAGLFRCDLRVESRPPTSAAPLTAAVSGGSVHADPDYVVSFPLPRDARGAHFTEAFCPFANLFPSVDAYRGWAAGQTRPTTAIAVGRAQSIAAAFAGGVLSRESGGSAAPAESGCGASRR